ncbi:MAG: caspase family protein [Pseudomonadota bacterium]
MRIALSVGINYYNDTNQCLNSCVDDALTIHRLLSRHEDGSKNFDSQPLVAESDASRVNRAPLEARIRKLFDTEADIALLYYAGHGFFDSEGGYLLPSDTVYGDDGVSLQFVLDAANGSKAKHRVIILDSCYSGAAGESPALGGLSGLADGVTVLTSSTKDQVSKEVVGGHGVFTSLLIDALEGAAANLLGEVTPGSVYAHIDQSLGAWDQRPVFKANVKKFASLRQTKPTVDLADLHQMKELFEAPDYVLPLTPEYEPAREGRTDLPPPDPEKTKVFALLQRLVKCNLVRPVGAEHMYYAALESKGCELKPLGRYYWRLVARGRL